MSKIKYSIIVPTYNNFESCLQPCVESLISHTDPSNTEIIIVANGCTDGTRDYLMTLDNRFKIVWSTEALGYTRATNLGMKNADGEYFVLLNNDNVIYDKTWLLILEKPFLLDKSVGITGPVKDMHVKTGVEFLLFFCAMIRRDVVEKIGLLDEAFNPGYGEDIDYCAKIKNAGYKVVQVPHDDVRAADASNVGHVINFPLWHKGSQTVHKVNNWEDIVKRNEEILRLRYVEQKNEKKPKYTVIIPTYNHLDDCLRPCVESLMKFTDLKDFEVLIVANGCTDGTKEYVNSLPDNFKLIWNDAPLGFPKAVNLGLRHKRGQYVIMLNNDVVLTQQPKNYWLMLLERPFVANEKIGITGAYKSVFALVDNNIRSVFFKESYVPFFCAMIKSSVIDDIGMLDESFGLGYAEDVDFCIRLANKGYLMAQVPYDVDYEINDLSLSACDRDLAVAKNKIQFPIFHAKSQTFSGLGIPVDDNTSLIYEKYGKKKLNDLQVLRLNFLKRILLGVVDDKISQNFFASKNYPQVAVMEQVVSQNLDTARVEGTIWPDHKAFTMVGLRRLDNLHYCLDQIRYNNIDGDCLEAGVWRGGACIFIKAYIEAYGMQKNVIVADSFNGVPQPEVDKYPQDASVSPMLFSDYLKVSINEVRQNFAAFNLLDDRVIFVEGKFSDTLNNNQNINKLCLLRFDADTYEATTSVLNSTYYKLNTGGFCIIDDYYQTDLVKQATNSFRIANWIDSEIIPIDNLTGFWRKEKLKFSIVIPTYNHLDDCLKPCIESILNNTNLANVEIVVVANGCVDGTKEYLDLMRNQIKSVWFDNALGYPKATNAGIDVCQGDYIILLNNDATILPFYPLNGWINCLYQACLQDNIGLAGPQKLFCDMLEFVFLCFFCVMIRRDVIDAIGKIDEEFHDGYCDDNDFCYRAIKAGFKYVQVPFDKDVSDESTSFPIYHRKAATFSSNKICNMHNCANQKYLLLKYAEDTNYIKIKYEGMRSYILSSGNYYHNFTAKLRTNKIFDCFLFNNELDLLEIRLHELSDIVDYFVIVEARKTFTNHDKKLYFDDNKEKFAKFSHKIRHIIVDDMPDYGNGYDANWKREIYQRNCIKRALTDCKSHDILIIADVDEIPNKNAIQNYDTKLGICNLQMSTYYFFLNYKMLNSIWNNVKILPYAELRNRSCNDIRCLHQTVNLHTFIDAGWHFSYLGNYNNILQKMSAISHQEYNTEKYLEKTKLFQNIIKCQDIYDRGLQYQIVAIDDKFPNYVIQKQGDLVAKNYICLQSFDLEYLNKVFMSKMKPKIYDCFIFFNELDLLYFRMQELKDVVDYFVICEATLTHAGVKKPLYYAENKNRFIEFQDKIIHVVVENLPNRNESPDNWYREGYHRDCIIRGLNNCDDSDIIILSDLDEIPNVDAIKNYDPQKGICCLDQKIYYYYMNYRLASIDRWIHAKIGTFGEMKKTYLTGIRALHASNKNLEIIPNGGWHFSFLGGKEKIQEKLKAYCHQEFNKPEFTSLQNIENAVNEKVDILARNYEYVEVEIDHTFPKYLQKNLQYYMDIGFIKNTQKEQAKVINKNVKYSIIIPTFNHLEDCLKPCIESIKNYTDLSDFEVLIVANGCTDGTKQYVENLGSPFRLIWHNDPLGYAKPVNIGMKEAVGEYIILLNNDIVLLGQEKNTWINMLIYPFLVDEKVSATGPLVLLDGFSDCKFILSFCMMIKKSAIDQVGYLDDSYGFGGGEDVDFCARLQLHGYTLAQVPDSSQFNGLFNHGGFPIYHKSNASRGDVAAIVDMYHENNKNIVRNLTRYNKNIKLNIENKKTENLDYFWSLGSGDNYQLQMHPKLESFPANSVVEIYAGDYVDSLHNDELVDILSQWCSKIKPSGKISIASNKFGSITITKEPL